METAFPQTLGGSRSESSTIASDGPPPFERRFSFAVKQLYSKVRIYAYLTVLTLNPVVGAPVTDMVILHNKPTPVL